MRDHQPIVIDNFNGLWSRGDNDTCPQDHWTDCQNMAFSESSAYARFAFTNDYGSGISGKPFIRQHLFTTTVSGVPTVFIISMDTGGTLYSQQISPLISGNVGVPTALGTPNVNALDFDLTNFNGRAYITISGATVGLVGTPVYWYDGINFGITGGTRPTIGSWNVTTNAPNSGNITIGSHAFAVAFETSNGFVSSLLYFNTLVHFDGTQSAHMTGLPIGPTGTVARRIYMSKAVTDLIPPSQTIPYFVLRVADNTTTTIDVNAYDSQLLQNDLYLYTVLDQLPSGVGIGKYHNRLVVWGFPYQTITIRTISGGPNVTLNLTPSTILFSNIGDPETIDTLNNIVIIDGNAVETALSTGSNLPIGATACQEYRDLCYVFKFMKTFALTDNNDVPATWAVTVVDEGTGSFVHGVSTVLDSGGVSYEYLVIANSAGVFTFNGLFVRPELSYKIADLWKNVNKAQADHSFSSISGKIHIVLDTLNKQIYILIGIKQQLAPSILLCDYANSFIGDPNFSQACKWSIWTFAQGTSQLFTLVSWDNNIKLVLTGYDAAAECQRTYNGNQLATLPERVLSPFFQTYLITPQDGSYAHLGGIRYRVEGNMQLPGTLPLSTLVVNEDATRTQQLADVPTNFSMGKEPFLLANWISQKFMLKVSVPDNTIFSINKMTPFVGSVYSGGPQ